MKLLPKKEDLKKGRFVFYGIIVILVLGYFAFSYVKKIFPVYCKSNRDCPTGSECLINYASSNPKGECIKIDGGMGPYLDDFNY